MCGGGEEKRKARGTWVVGEKKKKEMGSGVYVYGGKKGEWKKKEGRVEKEMGSGVYVFIITFYN